MASECNFGLCWLTGRGDEKEIPTIRSLASVILSGPFDEFCSTRMAVNWESLASLCALSRCLELSLSTCMTQNITSRMPSTSGQSPGLVDGIRSLCFGYAPMHAPEYNKPSALGSCRCKVRQHYVDAAISNRTKQKFKPRM